MACLNLAFCKGLFLQEPVVTNCLHVFSAHETSQKGLVMLLWRC